MDRRTRSNLVGGLILLVLGMVFLAGQIFPDFNIWINAERSWPLFIVAVGILLFIFGLIVGEPGMAVPASIVGGIGGLLYWQNATGNWTSWAYAWALIPGFVGVGTLIAAILGSHPRQSRRDGINLIVISAVLFIVFGSFFGGFNVLGVYWPVLLIILGLFLLLRTLWRRG
jgi:hypothetical protein